VPTYVYGEKKGEYQLRNKNLTLFISLGLFSHILFQWRSIWYAANFRWVSRYIRYRWKIMAGYS